MKHTYCVYVVYLKKMYNLKRLKECLYVYVHCQYCICIYMYDYVINSGIRTFFNIFWIGK